MKIESDLSKIFLQRNEKKTAFHYDILALKLK